MADWIAKVEALRENGDFYLESSMYPGDYVYRFDVNKVWKKYPGEPEFELIEPWEVRQAYMNDVINSLMELKKITKSEYENF